MGYAMGTNGNGNGNGADPPTSKPIGRPTVWTPAVEAEVLECLELGMSDRWAARSAGIHSDTLVSRLAEDADFSVRCQGARAAGFKLHLTRLKEAKSKTKLAAAKFFLSTHDREQWSTMSHLKVSGNINIAVSVADLIAKEDEAIALREKALSEAKP